MSGSEEIELEDEVATKALAIRVAVQLRRGDAVLLEGNLGAGKTTFARHLLRTLNNDPTLDVPSPSYTLVQSYETFLGTVHHLDLWRLSGPEELVELGWEDMLSDIVLVEWAERLGPNRPEGALTVVLRLISETARRATLSGWSRAL